MSAVRTPLLSVVIPTYKRPKFLRRAIASALLAAPDSDLEVIVVPNGPDDSWKSVAADFDLEVRIRWLPITMGNANAARNYGMQSARGRYLRFLDDDDIFYTEGACAQCTLIERTGADVCSAPIHTLDDGGEIRETLYQPDTPDFIAGILSHKRMHQVTAHLFRLSSVKSVPWDELLAYSQDIDWILRLCQKKELQWVKTEDTCGGWTRHTNTRTSIKAPLHDKKKVMAEKLLLLLKALKERNALTASRREAAALGLWDCVHQTLFAAPSYWRNIAKVAVELAPQSKPDLPMHRTRLSLLGVSPIAIEIVVAPKRLVGYWLRRVQLHFGLLRSW